MKLTLYIVTLVAIGYVLHSCADKLKIANTYTKESNIDSANKTTDQHTSANSLDWDGIYQGILPRPDCEGIRTTITLNRDHTYFIESIYLGTLNKAEKENGNFSWN